MQSSARIHWQGRLQESASHEIENIALNFSFSGMPGHRLRAKETSLAGNRARQKAENFHNYTLIYH
jgi:hypothetical protein